MYYIRFYDGPEGDAIVGGPYTGPTEAQVFLMEEEAFLSSEIAVEEQIPTNARPRKPKADKPIGPRQEGSIEYPEQFEHFNLELAAKKSRKPSLTRFSEEHRAALSAAAKNRWKNARDNRAS